MRKSDTRAESGAAASPAAEQGAPGRKAAGAFPCSIPRLYHRKAKAKWQEVSYPAGPSQPKQCYDRLPFSSVSESTS